MPDKSVRVRKSGCATTCCGLLFIAGYFKTISPMLCFLNSSSCIEHVKYLPSSQARVVLSYLLPSWFSEFPVVAFQRKNRGQLPIFVTYLF
jgi:hypothetical protein